MESHPYVPGQLFRKYKNDGRRASREPVVPREQLQQISIPPSSDRVVDVDELDEVEQSVVEIDVATTKTTTTQAAKTKRSSSPASLGDPPPKKVKKWTWTPELVEILLGYIKEYKTQCEFNGLDFEADLQSMYTEVRQCMASHSPTEFGPETSSEPIKNIKEMDKNEYEAYRRTLDAEKKAVRRGYERIKEKIKSVRQDFRTAVNKGTRSGSGRIVKENYELLTEIWGGSPATGSLPFGIDGSTEQDPNTENENEEDDIESRGI